jgi:CheY-like chemotaxis protein
MTAKDPLREHRLDHVAADFAVADAEQTLILVVDDNAALRDLTGTYLETQDNHFRVITADSAAAAIDTLYEQPVDCIVSDYEMPGLDGLQLLRAVREDHPEVPFILFTSKGSEAVASDAISRGVTDYLQKGGTEQYELLANRVANVVERSRRGSELRLRRRQIDTLVDNLPGMVYRADIEPPWPMTFAGGAVESLTGHSQAAFECGEVTFGELIVDADSDRVDDIVTAAVEAGEPFEATYEIETADGTRKRVWERGSTVYDHDGDPVALEGFIMDVGRIPDEPTTGGAEARAEGGE